MTQIKNARSRGGLSIVVLGLSITSSWGNGHATTYRALVRGLAERGHDILFLERETPWYSAHRDLPHPPFCVTKLYRSVKELDARWSKTISKADLVILGSYVPDGVEVARLLSRLSENVLAFYDIDTPVTLAGLAADSCEYLSAELIPQFDLYLSFTGGPALEVLQSRYGARLARPLYCSIDPSSHWPEARDPVWDLGYLGTYSPDRQATLDALLLQTARIRREARFAVAGPQYPASIDWPRNVDRFEHLPPGRHRSFYAGQRFTLNVTRADMVRMGHSPSVRLFEAAACGVPLISDWWTGLDELFIPDEEVLIARSTEDVIGFLSTIDEDRRRRIGGSARKRVLAQHTAADRAAAVEAYFDAALSWNLNGRALRA